MNPERRRFLMVLGGAGALTGLGMWALPAGLKSARRASRALGSQVSMTALHEQQENAERAIADAFAELERVEEVMSLYRPSSQLCRLNRDGALQRPHPYLVAVLRRAQEMSEQCDGAFDATVQPLWELYAAAAKSGRLPDAVEVEAARRKVDWRKVDVSKEKISFRAPEMSVTLNGIAQGFAADRALDALRARGVRHALVDTGELGAIGRKAGGEPWSVGIQHPRRADAYVELARLEGRCMATSGDYATTFTPDRAYNHIFDPATGRSPEHFSSVTVVAPNGMDADALSTAIFVAGLQQGLALVESTPGCDALFVLKDGRVVSTKNFPRAA